MKTEQKQLICLQYIIKKYVKSLLRDHFIKIWLIKT